MDEKRKWRIVCPLCGNKRETLGKYTKDELIKKKCQLTTLTPQSVRQLCGTCLQAYSGVYL